MTSWCWSLCVTVQVVKKGMGSKPALDDKVKSLYSPTPCRIHPVHLNDCEHIRPKSSL
jgi:hypothetical protein